MVFVASQVGHFFCSLTFLLQTIRRACMSFGDCFSSFWAVYLTHKAQPTSFSANWQSTGYGEPSCWTGNLILTLLNTYCFPLEHTISSSRDGDEDFLFSIWFNFGTLLHIQLKHLTVVWSSYSDEQCNYFSDIHIFIKHALYSYVHAYSLTLHNFSPCFWNQEVVVLTEWILYS